MDENQDASQGLNASGDSLAQIFVRDADGNLLIKAGPFLDGLAYTQLQNRVRLVEMALSGQVTPEQLQALNQELNTRREMIDQMLALVEEADVFVS